MVYEQKLEQSVHYYERKSSQVYSLLASRCSDIEMGYRVMGRVFYNPFKSKDNYKSNRLFSFFIKWLCNSYFFKKENKDYAEEVEELLKVKNYFDVHYREKLEQEKDENRTAEELNNLEEIVSHIDKTIAIYSSIIKRRIKN